MRLALPDGVALDVVTGELDGISRDGATASIRLGALRALTASWQLLYPGAMGRQTLLRRLLEPGTPSELLDGLAADAAFCASLAADVLGSDGETDVRVGDGSAAMIKLMKCATPRGSERRRHSCREPCSVGRGGAIVGSSTFTCGFGRGGAVVGPSALACTVGRGGAIVGSTRGGGLGGGGGSAGGGGGGSAGDAVVDGGIVT